MVSRLKYWRMDVNSMQVADMQFSETKDRDLSQLTDNELDDVNGGLLWFVAAGAYLVGVGAVAGYYATKAIMRRL